MEFRVAGLLRTAELREKQIVGGCRTDDRKVAVAPRQDPVCEDQEVRFDSLGLELLAAKLQDASDLRGVRKISKGPKVNSSFRLPSSLSTHEATAPGLSPSPNHGQALSAVEVVELQLGLYDGI